jgi:outer membrane protein assembly factor BamB
MKRSLGPVLAVGIVAAVFAPSAFSAPASGAPTTGSSGGWLVYHGSSDGDGVAAGVASVSTSVPAWSSPTLDGQLFGEPLVSGGRIYVATENDTVYALSATTGSVIWSVHLGSAVSSSALTCGDISPTVGITGTPVIDQARSELFVVADEMVDGRAAHKLVGLDTGSGKTELNQDVDPAGAAPTALLQRTGLTLDAGRVVFGYGGNYGDCGSYHGWVVAVPEAGGAAADFEVDGAPGESQGAVWMGGAAPVVDAGGNVWVTAGNGSVGSASQGYDDSDSVLELSPTLSLRQYFAPATWATDNATDSDMATGPALLGDGQVVAAGKSRVVYLLNAASLGGIGAQQASLPAACQDDIEGGVAVVGTTVYLPCLSGIIAVRASSAPASLRVLWSSGVGGGPPIVAAGLVWTIGSDGTLSGLDPATGAVRQQATIGAPANHFPTPSVGAGLLLTPASDRVVAFRAPQSAPSTSASTTSTTAPAATTTAPPPASAAGHATPRGNTGVSDVTLAVVVGIFAVAGAATGLVLRRIRRGRIRRGGGPAA